MEFGNDSSSEEILTARITELKQMHRDLDETIQDLEPLGTADQLRLRRLKKQKLMIKDQIARMESMLIPDMDA